MKQASKHCTGQRAPTTQPVRNSCRAKFSSGKREHVYEQAAGLSQQVAGLLLLLLAPREEGGDGR